MVLHVFADTGNEPNCGHLSCSKSKIPMSESTLGYASQKIDRFESCSYLIGDNSTVFTVHVVLQIKWENLSGCLTNLLGHGSYGDVWEAHYHSAPVAVKTIKIETTPSSLHQTLTQFK